MAGVISALTAIVLPQYALPVVVVGGAIEMVRHVRGGKEEEIDEDVGMMQSPSKPVEPVTLAWKDVCFEVVTKKKGKKDVLKNCTGEARPGRLMAIMGPSGAGKTSLLNALAGQVPEISSAKLTGVVLTNSKRKISDCRQAYVTQNNYFFSCLTVRETLEFAAKVKLPSTMSTEEKNKIVDALILKLGLAKCADTLIGNVKTPGISGGEKKRVGIACELISAPSLVFVDEPTSGLDSFQAEQVMAALRKLADDGHTVICSIHQPRGSIFNMFDDICLIAEGQTLFCGSTADALKHFESLGYPCPPYINPAEHFADIISIDYTSKEQETKTLERLSKFLTAFHKQIATAIVLPDHIEDGSNRAVKPHLPWFQQLGMLFERSLKQVTRDKKTTLARVIPCITSALMFGMIYWRVGKSQSSIQDRVGLMQVCATNAAMLSVTRTLNLFPPEKSLVDRERVSNSYGVLPYLIGKVAAELPFTSFPPLLFGLILYPMAGLEMTFKRLASFVSILLLESAAAGAVGVAVGSGAPSTEAALAMGPSLMLMFILFGGFYVNAMNVPLVLRWIPRVSMIRWSFGSLCTSQFRGLEFDTVKDGDTKTGEEVLDRIGFGNESFHVGVSELLRITLFFYVTAYGLLKKRKPTFKQMVVPMSIEEENMVLNGGRVVEIEE